MLTVWSRWLVIANSLLSDRERGGESRPNHSTEATIQKGISMDLIKLHKNFNVHFFTLGNTLQTRTGFLCPATFDQNADIILVEPGRLVIIDLHLIEADLVKLLQAYGKPALNEMTITSNRPNGLFSTRVFESFRKLLFVNHEYNAPRAKPERRVHKEIVYRDLEPV